MDDHPPINLQDAHAALCEDAEAVPVAQRRQLVTVIADDLVNCAPSGAHVDELIDRLAVDPDWTVRLEVARMAHLLEGDACVRYVTMFRKDCNRYVRTVAERSLARQRKARQSSHRRSSKSRTWADQLDQMARRHGRQIAAKVESLAEQRFANLTAAAAHDLRTVLTTLTANVAALADEFGPSRRIRSIADDIRFLQRRIEAMERFSEPLPVERHPEDLGDLIHHAVNAARESVVGQEHDPAAVVVEVQPVRSLRVRVARQLIVLALTNVIENAFEAFAEQEVDALRPGRIRIQVHVDGYDTRIVVEDDGPGIEAAVLRELTTFVPAGPNKNKRLSSGWGLSLVNRYIAAHNGVVDIDSKEGTGTTVTITLPQQDHEEEPAA